MKVRDIRGVNLGGWLVLERWMTPSVFKDVKGPDEHSLSGELGSKEAKRRLNRHRDTFITETHIKQIKQLGLNSVRLPVGYWLFEDIDGFVGGAYKYVDTLFQWTTKYGLQVLLCLHGAPGSQNGWDHSGRAGEIGWHAGRDNLQKTLETIERISQRYGQNTNLFGIELLNEPHPSVPLRELVQYYRRAARIIRRYGHRRIRWVVSDAFRPRQMTLRILFNWFRHPILDQHMYQLFTPEDRMLSHQQHIQKAQRWSGELKWRARVLPVIIGEWSAAMDELYQPALKKNAQPFTAAQYSAYAREQQRSFERAGCGWFYWTARTEDRGIWSLLDHPELLID